MFSLCIVHVTFVCDFSINAKDSEQNIQHLYTQREKKRSAIKRTTHP